MKSPVKPIVAAAIAMAAQFGAGAYAQSPPASAASTAHPAAPIAEKAPEAWIQYDDTTYTPVVDEMSRRLNSARTAFEAKDMKKAAAEMHAVADELKLEAVHADEDGKTMTSADTAQLAADRKLADDVVKHLNLSAQKVDSAANAIATGKMDTVAELNKAIDKATRADMDQRWQVTDVTTWYPLVEEPQHQFTDAVAANVKKDYAGAAADIRKAAGYLRLEAGRATGDAKHELDKSVLQLEALAASVDAGGAKDERAMRATFEKAEQALASAHHAKAAEALARKQNDKAGYEIMAAARGLESAADWAGGKAKAGVSATVAESRALGDKLATGATLAHEEATKGLDKLGKGIDALGRKTAGAQ